MPGALHDHCLAVSREAWQHLACCSAVKLCCASTGSSNPCIFGLGRVCFLGQSSGSTLHDMLTGLKLVAANRSMSAYPLAVQMDFSMLTRLRAKCMSACCNDSAMHFTSAPPRKLTRGVLCESRWMSQHCAGPR